MIKSAFIFSTLFLLNTTTTTILNETPNNFYSECEYSLNEEINLLATKLGFNTKEEIIELDWNTIEFDELEEDIEIGFDTKKYLPENFNPLKEMYDIDWSSIEIAEIDEEVEFNFDTKAYLPKGFNAYKGMCAYNMNGFSSTEL